MRYAILNNSRVEAKTEYREQKCICPECNAEVIPVCGNTYAHHWRHKVKTDCILEYTPMTPWHKAWQNQFDDSCREIVHFDEITKEKHVADIKTQNGIIVELQHSAISIEERVSREKFYKNMIWIIDGRKYYEKFKKIKYKQINQYQFICLNPNEGFPSEWLNCSVPIYFDYLGLDNHLNENFFIFELTKRNNQILITKILIKTFIQEIKNAKAIIPNNINYYVIPQTNKQNKKNVIRKNRPYMY